MTDSPRDKMPFEHSLFNLNVDPPNASMIFKEGLSLLKIPGLLSKFPFQKNTSVDHSANIPTIVLLPGFLTTPLSMHFIKRSLKKENINIIDWGLGFNYGCAPLILENFCQKIKDINKEHGKVILLGWSLGGYIARETARELPDSVSRVITMASPVIGGLKYTAAQKPFMKKGYNIERTNQMSIERYKVPLTTKTLALYSKVDGIVNWKACIDSWSPNIEHKKVSCNHMTFGFNMEVIQHIKQFLNKEFDAC